MINNNNNFDYELFVRLYNEFLPIKLEIDIDNNPHDIEGHEWIDIDEVISNNQQRRNERIEKK